LFVPQGDCSFKPNNYTWCHLVKENHQRYLDLAREVELHTKIDVGVKSKMRIIRPKWKPEILFLKPLYSPIITTNSLWPPSKFFSSSARGWFKNGTGA